MCGIFGATERERYLNLLKLNKARGDFAQSCALIERSGFEIHKVPLRNAATKYRFPKKKKFDLYLGHVQSPTSAVREFSLNTTHPFIVENWVVAHNGVITNHKQLIDQFEMPYKNPVDSSIIPFILYSMQACYNKEIDIITASLSMLQGTFGLWIHNADTGNTFLVKCGVTLFADLYENTFSSIQTNKLEPLEDGVLYQFTTEGLTTVAEFEYDNPFFTL